MRGLASPHPFLGATALAVEARVVLASAVFFIVQFVVGDMEWLASSVAGWRTWWWECRLLSGLPSYSVASGAGAPRASVMDVSVIIQLMFLQHFEDVEVPQIPSSTECSGFQLYYRVVYVQCKLCKNRRYHSAVLGQVVHAPFVMLRQVLGVGQCRKLWKFRSCRWCSSWRLLTRPLFL